MIQSLTPFLHQIVFIHILSAFIWVGGMIAIRLAVHPTMQLIEDNQIRLSKTLQIMGRFFNLVIAFIVLIVATGFIMALIRDGHHTEDKFLFISKEAIWTIMTINFGFMYYKRAKAWRLFLDGKFVEAKNSVAIIPNYLLPLNILLGIVALWLGVSLRGL